MKKHILLPLLILLTLSAFSQTDSTSLPPYKRFPTVPPFKILLTDSTTWLTKENLPAKRATMVILFSPDCDHCKHETEQLLSEIDKFKKIEIVMATPLPFEKMKEFYGHYDLGRFKNIHVGRDVNFILPVFFDARSLPYLAFYDKKGRLIDAFEGSLPIEQVLEKFKE